MHRVLQNSFLITYTRITAWLASRYRSWYYQLQEKGRRKDGDTQTTAHYCVASVCTGVRTDCITYLRNYDTVWTACTQGKKESRIILQQLISTPQGSPRLPWQLLQLPRGDLWVHEHVNCCFQDQSRTSPIRILSPLRRRVQGIC